MPDPVTREAEGERWRMTDEKAIALGQQIELAFQVDGEAVRNVLDTIDHSARSLAEDAGGTRPAAAMLIISAAINEAVS